MKNKLQTINYLKDKTFQTEIDFKAVRAYCKQELGIVIHKAHIGCSLDPDCITCADFFKWQENGLSAGDVVKWKDKWGILQNSNPEQVKICFSSRGNVPNFDFLILDIQDIQKANEIESEALKCLLENTGKTFDHQTFQIADYYIPGPGHIVMFRKHNPEGLGPKCYGVVNQVLEDEIHMFCYFDENEVVHYSMDENLGKLRDFEFTQESVSGYGIKKLKELMGRVGKNWNHSLRRVEPLKMKREAGKPYWYISDQLVIRKAFDDGKAETVHAKRFRAGNYFYSENRAGMMRTEFDKLAKKYFAEPEIIPDPANNK